MNSDLDCVNEVNSMVERYVDHEVEKRDVNMNRANYLHSDVERMKCEIEALDGNIDRMRERLSAVVLPEKENKKQGKSSGSSRRQQNAILVLGTAIITIVTALLLLGRNRGVGGDYTAAYFTPPS